MEFIQVKPTIMINQITKQRQAASNSFYLECVPPGGRGKISECKNKSRISCPLSLLSRKEEFQRQRLPACLYLAYDFLKWSLFGALRPSFSVGV
jgi:hypothetical protein